MDLSEKIKLILSGKNISPSIFADEIGVQRSSMSHILAGRNKPSLDIVQKIIKRFPDLGMNWIMDDQDLPLLSSEVSKSISNEGSHGMSSNPEIELKTGLNEAKYAEKPVQHDPMPHTVAQAAGKAVTKIMVFYSDGTFQELNPTG